jgi:hypothetical protein
VRSAELTVPKRLTAGGKKDSDLLVEVMPDWHFRTFDLSLVRLGNRHISKPCRLFKEFATQMAPRLFPSLPI